jgi:hypothetical protein
VFKLRFSNCGAFAVAIAVLISGVAANAKNAKPGYVCFPVTPGPVIGGLPRGPGPVLLEVQPVYVRPGEVAAFDMGNAGVKLDAESASGVIGALATFETMRSAGAGMKTLEAFQDMQAVRGGVERLDRAMPNLVEQLKLGNPPIQLEMK